MVGSGQLDLSVVVLSMDLEHIGLIADIGNVSKTKVF